MLRPSSTALARLTAAVEKPTHGPDQYIRVLREDVEALLRLVGGSEKPPTSFEVPLASWDPYRDGLPQRVEPGFAVFRVFANRHAPLSARSYIHQGPGAGGFYSRLTPDEVVQASMGGGV